MDIMKHINFISILFMLLFMACKTEAYLTIEVLQPAEINMPLKMKNVAVVTHGAEADNHPLLKSKEHGKVLKDIEKFSLDASKAYVDGLSDILYSSPRYVVKEPALINIERKISSEGLPPMNWNDVADICRDKESEALISLEHYSLVDSSAVFYLSKYYQYYAFFRLVNVSLWRVYLPSEKAVADEYVLRDTLYWEGFGTTPRRALEDIPFASDAVQLSAYDAGSRYGLRIAPIWTEAQRSYYVSGNKDFRKAYKHVKNEEWLKAADLWKKQLDGGNKYTQYKAAYNLALVAEINDKLELAKEWAEKSYKINEDPKTKAYIEKLDKRIEKKEALINQLP